MNDVKKKYIEWLKGQIKIDNRDEDLISFVMEEYAKEYHHIKILNDNDKN
jgi:hypothetical protein